ncbi:MAG TPA: alpha/beta fold hydrolase [Candidatus Baltobacteraceae bacterium]
MGFARLTLALFSALALIAAAPEPAAQSAGLGLHVHSCVVPQTKIPAQCGTFGVYEKRAAHAGRVIQLQLMAVPAVHPQHRAIAEIAGGPGQAITPFAGYFLSGQAGKARSTLHQTYDYIYMNDRGMMGSNDFNCDFAPANDPGAYMAYLFPPKILASCRAKNLATHDLPQYNTNNAVDDLDDIRAALGYDKIVLSGGSYGTFFSLVYLRRHAQHVESEVLDGVAPPGFQPLPGEPLGAQHALDDLFLKCRTNAACNSRFPLFKQHFHELLQRFNSGPLMVPAKNITTKRMQTVPLSKEVFVDTLRHLLYDSAAASYVPYIVEQAYDRDYAPLGQMMQLAIFGEFAGLEPAYLAYSCSDFMPFLSASQVRYAAAHSFTGDLRIKAQQQACKTWAVPPMPASFNDPVRSDVPVLMILGSDDPATPAKYGLEALRYLPNGRAVLVNGGGHGADTACTDTLVVQFVHAQSAAGLNLKQCSSTFTLPRFATSMKGLPPLP